jgi:hypothetical protein
MGSCDCFHNPLSQYEALATSTAHPIVLCPFPVCFTFVLVSFCDVRLGSDHGRENESHRELGLLFVVRHWSWTFFALPLPKVLQRTLKLYNFGSC